MSTPVTPAVNKTQQIKQLIDMAVANGSTAAAIQKYGAGLSTQELATIKSLTPTELKSIASVQQKLSNLPNIAADNNNAY